MLKSKENQKVPSVTFRTRNGDAWEDVSSDDVFKGKNVIVFSLPGAFTPTCSSTHLPRYNELAPVFFNEGIDEIVCVSVNDTFVMNAWKADQEAQNITVLPDGNGEFTDGMGMLVSKDDLGFGKRSWRGDPFEVSDADTMLDYLNPNATVPASVAILTKPGCGFCAKAKQLLDQAEISYEEIVLGTDATSVSLKAISGQATVPQVFVDGEHIGDSEALIEWLNASQTKAA